MANDDRRRNDGNRDRLDQIQQGYLRFSKRIAIAMTVQGVGLILALVIGLGIGDNRDNSVKVENISDEQRRELACAVLDQMRGATARELRRETECNERGGP